MQWPSTGFSWRDETCSGRGCGCPFWPSLKWLEKALSVHTHALMWCKCIPLGPLLLTSRKAQIYMQFRYVKHQSTMGAVALPGICHETLYFVVTVLITAAAVIR